MKKKLESDLVSIAHRILKLKGREDVVKLQAEAGALYEALTVLKFAEENFDGKLPKIGNDSSFFGMLDSAFNNKVSDNLEIEDKIYVNFDDANREVITEPAMSKIKDMLEFMPKNHEDDKPAHEAFIPKETASEEIVSEDKVIEEKIIEEVVPKEALPKEEPAKKDPLEDFTEAYKEMPIFDPVPKNQNGVSNQKKSLNDKLKFGGFNIGLNDKIAFIKHLFDGKNEDYDRVISQLNTIDSWDNARNFIENMVKPDYNNWSGKEEFEERFIEIIEGKFN
ncbi:hypothetical protein Q4566_05395 [Tamlana sp. 2_MG-2023]|uniref:hypothetical protein n=1 Tax=unclassified Tamlana TaxID=2614803 RepID=UPI0026E25A0D|nr:MULTISPECIES: hypothetical protein [unclassified Tamlana]MDO6759629.1 hypothetical protein [Tamlana sp. 2_MG-2023]MDO6791252.1 hypothetical protein [Tamlana sp. 1_MG-2023]